MRPISAAGVAADFWPEARQQTGSRDPLLVCHAGAVVTVISNDRVVSGSSVI